jgi:hypothetical protein
MEVLDANDVFAVWIDIVKKHYPHLEITKELMDILFDTFTAGTVSQHLEGPTDITVVQPDSRLH